MHIKVQSDFESFTLFVTKQSFIKLIFIICLEFI